MVADEFFAWGVYGGFGAFTRKLAVELVKRGVDVEVFVHKISELQKPEGEVEYIDGVPVKTLPRSKLIKLRRKDLYKTDAEIIHSQSGMYDTYLVFKRNPEAKKIITFQDLRTKAEYGMVAKLELKSGYPWYKKLWAFYVNYCFRKAFQMADVVGYQAELLVPKIKGLYGEHKLLKFLPNFIDVQDKGFKKTDTPSVVWLARLDPIKRPELCFNLAKNCPHVDFFILGKSHFGIDYESKYKDVKNLHFLGFQSGDIKEETLSKAWILINTSIYECMPVSFLEALAHKCALLSTVNPDNYTVRFGQLCDSNVASLKVGLDALLYNDNWKYYGQKGYDHVKEVHSTEKGVEAHIQLYKQLLDRK